MAVIVSFVGKWDGKDVKRGIREMQALDRQVNGSERTFATSFGAIASKAAVAGAAIAGVGVVVGKAISAASNLAESQSKVSVVFGDQADSILEWSRTSATAFGQTQQQALEAAGTYGNLFQAFGLTRDAAQEMSTTMVELAADLASFNNTSIDDAIEALRSGLSGETEPLKRFGIALNDARMKQEALALGIYDGVGALDAAQKAQAAYAVILNDTTLAQGDFERTSDGLANQQRILQAQFGDLTAQLGQMLLPAALKVTSALNDMLGALQQAPTWFRENRDTIILASVAVAALAAALFRTQIALAATNLVLTTQRVLMGAYITAYATAAGSVTGFSRALGAVPWVAAITAITTLVLELDKGADEAERFRAVALRTARATQSWTDENGKLKPSIAGVVSVSRFVKYAQKDYLNAAEGARIYGNAALFAAGATDQEILSLRELINTIGQYVPMALAAADAANALRATSAETDRYTAQAKALGAEIGWGGRGLQRYNAYLDETADKAKKAGGSKKDLKDKFVALSDVLPELTELTRKYGIQFDPDSRIANAPKLLEQVKRSFADVSETVTKAQAAYDGTYQSVYDTFSGLLSLSNAADTFTERQRRAAESLQELNEYRAQLSEDATESELANLAKLQDAYQKAQTAAATGAQSIVEEFIEQAKKFGEFGAKLQELLRRGLNKTSFMQILQMGAERGSDVADAYLKGNTDQLIADTNQAVKAYDDLAKQIALETAQTFEHAGLAAALGILKGLSAALGRDGLTRKQIKAIIADLERELQVNVGINIAKPSGGGGGGGGGTPTPITTSVPSGAFVTIGGGGIPVAQVQDMPDIDALRQNLDVMFGPYPFAEGGIVMKPTLGLIGEAGQPEAVIPLDRLDKFGGDTSITINVHAGMGTNGAEVGRQIVDALKQYERRNGPVPISVA